MGFKSGQWSGALPAVTAPNRYFGTEADSDQVMRERYLLSLRSDAPTQWSSNRLGQSINSVGPIYVALKVLMDQAASAELHVSEWNEDARLAGDLDAKKPLKRSHDICRLLTRPNRRETGSYQMRQIVQQMGLTGMSLRWVIKSGTGRPKEMWSIPTGTYQPVPICETYPDGAYRIMPYFPGPLAMIPGAWNQGGVVVASDHITRIALPHPLIPQDSQSPLQACDQEMDTINGIGIARNSTVRRGAHPSATVELDPEVNFPDGPALTRLHFELRKLLGGPERNGDIAILSPGQKIVPYGSGAVEVGWIESWNQLVSFVMSVFGVTKSLAFMSEDASYATLYASLKQFNLFTLCPMLNMISDAVMVSVIEPHWGPDYFVEYKPRQVDDESQVEAALTNDLKAGIRTVNEIRTLRGLQKLQGPEGEERAYGSWKPAGAAPDANGQPGQNPDDAQGGTRQAGDGLPPKQAPVVEASRPKNNQGGGSLPPRIAPVAANRLGGKAWSGAVLLNGNGKH